MDKPTRQDELHNNLYLIGTPGEDVEYLDGIPSSRSVSNNLYLVVARSRGQAQYQIAKREGLEFFELRATIRRIGTISGEPRILPDTHLAWDHALRTVSEFNIPTM